MQRYMAARTALAAVIVFGAACSGGPRETSPDAADAPRGGDADDRALRTACNALASAVAVEQTEAVVTVAWAAARSALRAHLERAGSARGVRDWFAWFELHQIEGMLFACGFRGEDVRNTLASFAKHPALARHLEDERRVLCAFGASLVQASMAPWSEEQRTTWNAACVQLLSDATAHASAPVLAPAAPGAPAGGCAGVRELANARPQMVDRSLARDAWMAYGRALADCGPEAKPWEQLRIANGRQQFVDDYVVPFVNGDVARGSWFQTGDPTRYDRVVSHWLEGG